MPSLLLPAPLYISLLYVRLINRINVTDNELVHWENAGEFEFVHLASLVETADAALFEKDLSQNYNGSVSSVQ